MTAPVFLLRPLPETSRLLLDGSEGRHAATVRRLRAGERVDVTDGEGRLAECVVSSAERGRLELDVLAPHLHGSTAAAHRRRAGAGQGRAVGARRRAAHRGRRRRDRPVGGTALRCVVGAGQVRAPVGASGGRGSQAGPPRPVAGDRRRPRPRPRCSVGSAPLRQPSSCTRRRTAAGRSAPCRPTARSSSWSAPKAASLTTSWPASKPPVRARVRLGPSVLRASTAGCAAAAVILAATDRWK